MSQIKVNKRGKLLNISNLTFSYLQLKLLKKDSCGFYRQEGQNFAMRDI